VDVSGATLKINTHIFPSHFTSTTENDSDSDVSISMKRKRGRPKKLGYLRTSSPPQASKVARAHQRQFATIAPVVPAIIYDKLVAKSSRFTIRKKSALITMICKYWSLKREHRRGAPLLKRLHLEVRELAYCNRQYCSYVEYCPQNHKRKRRKN